VQEEFEGQPVGVMLIAAASMAVAGGSLIVGSLGARAFFERGSLGAWLFVGITVLAAAIALGCALSPTLIRLFPGSRPLPSSQPHMSTPISSSDPSDRSSG
jgi:hypothetical protein